LAAIERAVLAHGDSLVLRFPALVGPRRRHAHDRVAAALAAATACVVAGDPDRPFSYCHDDDAAEICALAVAGALATTDGTQVLNAASPDQMTVRGYYQGLADSILAGRPSPAGFAIIGDGAPQPRRRIDAGRLHRLLPGRSWQRP
jgi:nucleoside-diphosphate-sugar epimerase